MKLARQSMRGFGIDLAGYTTGKTALAVVEIEGSLVEATLLRDSALSRRRKSSDSLQQVLEQEAETLRRCLAVAPVAVDVPIDLQGLPYPANPERIWQLTRRPIDQVVNAMPALADRIGAPVARFAAIMRAGKFESALGERLFEAYPAATLKMLKIGARQYKGEKGMHALSALCTELKINPPVENDDDIDAIICAITAAAPAKAIHDAAALKVDGPMPKGFRIPKSLSFEKVEVRSASFETWMRSHEVAL